MRRWERRDGERLISCFSTNAIISTHNFAARSIIGSFPMADGTMPSYVFGSSAHIFKFSQCEFAIVHCMHFRSDSSNPNGGTHPVFAIFSPLNPYLLCAE